MWVGRLNIIMNHMEYTDVLDLDGKPTGQIKLKSEVHRDGDWHKTVHVWLINSRCELLIQKRASSKENYPNMWDISSAGHVLAGENSIAAAMREIREELGLKLPEENLEYLFSIKQQATLNKGTYINNEVSDVYLLPLDIDLSKLQLQREEVSEVKFIHFKELEKIIMRTDNSFVTNPEEYRNLFSELLKRYS